MMKRLSRMRNGKVCLFGLGLVLLSVTPLLHHQVSADETSGKKKFDPIEVNGEYFKGWPKPELLVVVTGRQEGYLEPCGCAGIENQKGGLARRFTLLSELRAKGWPVAPFDLGGLVRRSGPQAEIQFAMCARALKEMEYQGVGLGPGDLRLSDAKLLEVTLNLAPDNDLFVTGNYSVLQATPPLLTPRVNDQQIFVTSVISKTFYKGLSEGFEFVDPQQRLEELVKTKEFSQSKRRILLAYTTLAEAQALAGLPKLRDQFDVIAVAGDTDGDPANHEITVGKTWLAEMGHKGMFAVALGFFKDAKTPMRYQRIAIDSRYADAPQMLKLKRDYQSQLKTEYEAWLSGKASDGIGLSRDSSHPKAALQGKFVGMEKCAECHEDAMEVFQKTRHAHATQTLVKLDPPRQFDPECLSCHVTGWDPQNFRPYKSGFVSLDKSKHLLGNQCENCHGPGEKHVAAEHGQDAKLQKQLRSAMHVAKEYDSCIQCHDIDNSPEFKKERFDEYWNEIAH